jgi:hypothetical protein
MAPCGAAGVMWLEHRADAELRNSGDVLLSLQKALHVHSLRIEELNKLSIWLRASVISEYKITSPWFEQGHRFQLHAAPLRL